MKLLARTVLSAVSLAALAGCGGADKRAKVSGKVTVAGKDGLSGVIRFVSVADPNRAGGGQIKPDGTYEVTDAPVGECKVVVDNSHLDPNGKSAGMGMPSTGGMPGGMKGMPGGGPGRAAEGADKEKMKAAPAGAEVAAEMNQGKTDPAGGKYVRIDAAYTKPETTTLKAAVGGAGAGTFDFDVK